MTVLPVPLLRLWGLWSHRAYVRAYGHAVASPGRMRAYYRGLGGGYSVDRAAGTLIPVRKNRTRR